MRPRNLAGIAAASAFGVIVTGVVLGSRSERAAQASPPPAVNYAREFALESVKKACAPAYRDYARAYSNAIDGDARRRDACVPWSVQGTEWPVLDACCKAMVRAELEVARCSYAAAGLKGRYFVSGLTCEACRCDVPFIERRRP